MNTKVLIASLLVAFVCVQFVDSLVCYTCVTPNDCKKPKKVTCTNAAANETSNYLRVYHQNVQNFTSTRFDCLALQYKYNNNVVSQLHGCVHPNVYPCSLSLQPAFSHFNKTRCLTCSGDKCNKSPAGKMSSSTFTIAASVLGLLLVKILA
ncbi:uncharacterized protein LOC108102151 [Drosophila ficusphila]|uniref:uncharacterized protein LOC108102151 n=1 Tax=Drosophila ficusphila TaxID=30025 RepID=UPI001C8ADC23|nr:uncharacterized protein LOC108102151 [Drosophila ficusphila]